MESSIYILSLTAVSIGLIHTLIGPDHYLPFVMIGKAQRWSYKKLVAVTILCGIGHILSSVIIGYIGIALGVAVGELEAIEASRGEVASYLLIGLGLAYGVWGVFHALKSKEHIHTHEHIEGEAHEHEHSHFNDHSHLHLSGDKKSVTIWTVFIIFVFGPCEPLIPLLMYPASQHSYTGVAIVAGVFGIATITTMTIITVALYSGLNILPLGKLERFSHALAGFVIAVSGAAIVLLGV